MCFLQYELKTKCFAILRVRSLEDFMLLSVILPLTQDIKTSGQSQTIGVHAVYSGFYVTGVLEEDLRRSIGAITNVQTDNTGRSSPASWLKAVGNGASF